MRGPADPIALPPGRWVLHGNVQRFIADPKPQGPVDLGDSCGKLHGTAGGVKRHRKAGDKPCSECLGYKRESSQRCRIRKANLCADCGHSIRVAGRCQPCLEWAERIAVKQSWRFANRGRMAA